MNESMYSLYGKGGFSIAMVSLLEGTLQERNKKIPGFPHPEKASTLSPPPEIWGLSALQSKLRLQLGPVDVFFCGTKWSSLKRAIVRDLYMYVYIYIQRSLLVTFCYFFLFFVGLVPFFRLVFVGMDWMTTNYLRSLELFVGDRAEDSSPSFHRCHGIDLLKVVNMSILVGVGLPNIDSKHLI